MPPWLLCRKSISVDMLPTMPDTTLCGADSCSGAGSTAIRQWLGLHESALHGAGSQLRLKQEFITPHCPQQNGMVKRVIRSLKEQCMLRHRFETLQHASRVISNWIAFYNHRRPHQAMKMKTPAEALALAA